MTDGPGVALAAASNTSSVVCPDAGRVFGDTILGVFDSVAEVAACRLFPSCLVWIQVRLL